MIYLFLLVRYGWIGHQTSYQADNGFFSSVLFSLSLFQPHYSLNNIGLRHALRQRKPAGRDDLKIAVSRTASTPKKDGNDEK